MLHVPDKRVGALEIEGGAMSFKQTCDHSPGWAERAWDNPDWAEQARRYRKEPNRREGSRRANEAKREARRNGNCARQTGNGSATRKREGSWSGEGPVTVSKFDIFTARAWARATLFAGGEMTLHTAVDQLQQDAVASGLVAELGQDEIQHIMSAAFAPVRHDVGVTARDPDPVEVERKPDQPRAAASYVIWWPDIGLPGTSEMPVVPWPNWLRNQLSHSRCQITSRITVPDGHALTRLIRLIAGAREGERNNLTYWAACRAGEMVTSGLLDLDVAAAVIAEAATRAGLPRKEAERVAWSGIKTTGGVTHA
jgi:hypothetical protein